MAKVVDERGDVRDTKELNKTVTVSPTEARQGGRGTPVLKVLIGGLVLAVLAWGISEYYGESVDNDAATTRQSAPSATPNDTSATTPNQGTVDNTPPAGETMQPAPTDKDPTPQTGTSGTPQQP